MKKEEFYKEKIVSEGALEGIRVLEATTSGAGPWAGTLLADQGAETIRCEMPGTGDIIRRIPPFIEGLPPLENSTFHLSINRNKKSVTLDLRKPKGAELFRRLAAKMDIVVENFKPGTMEKWGVGYQEIRRVKPDIIYLSISGFGQFGPYSDKPGYDPVGQAMGGLMSVTGSPAGPPTRTGNAMADNITGWMGAFSAMVALHHRDKTGKGQQVDVCLVDSILYTSEVGIMAAANAGFLWQRMGNRHPAAAPYNTYECKDGYALTVVVLDSHWAKLCRLIGREELITDPQTSTPAARVKNVDLVDEALNAWTKERTVDEVVRAFEEVELVIAPILSFDQIIKNEHLLERESVAEVAHPTAGRLKIYGVAPKHSVTPGRVRTPAPTLGQHNEEVYQRVLGLSQPEIAQLKEEGII